MASRVGYNKVVRASLSGQEVGGSPACAAAIAEGFVAMDKVGVGSMPSCLPLTAFVYLSLSSLYLSLPLSASVRP